MVKFIGIDIGASFIKGGLFDLDTLVIKNIIKYPSPRSSNNNNSEEIRFEADVALYYSLVVKLIKELLSTEDQVDGIVFSTQMHGMVLVDANLNTITPFIGWQDERLLEETKKNQTWLDILNKRLRGLDLSDIGIAFRSGLMGSTLFWLKENGVLKKHKYAKALFLGDYIAARLTKGKLVTHPTNACGSGLFNVKENKWDEKIINALGLNDSFLPEVVSTGARVGFYQFKKKSIPVFVCVGDLQAAVLGSLTGLEKNREININIGTGSQVSCISTKFRSGQYDIRSYFDHTYLNTITFIPAGRALNVITQFIEEIGKKIYNKKISNVWQKVNELMSGREESAGLKANISFFKNSITQNELGSFYNISEKNLSIENMLISAIENMAENYLSAYKRLVPIKTDKIICSGGVIRKLHLLQTFLSKKFKRNVYLSPYTEDTLVGLFILSLVSHGNFTTVNDASLFIQKNKITFK